MACAIVCNVAQAAAEDRVNGVTVDGGDAANFRAEATSAPWDSDGRTLVTGSTGLVDDWADYYEVAIVRTGTLGLDLYGLSEDLDLLLFNSAGELLERPGTSGPDPESIVYTVTAGERYVVGVVPYEGVSSDYSLGMVSPSVDDDGDGVPNLDDLCPNTPPGTTVDEFGCPPLPDDADGDGVTDDIDLCPDTPAGASVNLDGCSDEQLDSDGDGVNDALDQCPDTPAGTTVDEFGCPLIPDSDGDGVNDALDLCPGTPAGTAVDADGCPLLDFTVEALRADPRFSHLDGAGYTIVVLDSGIDLDNPAFGADANGDGVADRILFAQDFSNDGDATAEDVFGHGTRVASVLGSSSPTAPGVAPGVNIVALQVLDNNGNGTGESLERALQWVIDNESAFNIVAVNLPIGQGINSSVPFSGFLSDEMAVLAEVGVVTIAAAGNDYYSYQTEGLDYPAAEPSAIAVGATFAGDMGPVDWSNSNGARAFTSDIDRILPLSQRSSLLGTVFAPVVPTPFDNEMGGTGLASAYVAGLVALSQQLAEEVLGQRLTPAQLRSLLSDSADSIVDGNDEDDNVDNTGKSFPRINAVALAEAISAFDPNGGTPPNQDDIPGDLSTQATLPMDSSFEGKLQYKGDTDWYRLELSAGIGYRLAMIGITLEDPYLSLFDSAGALVGSNNHSDGSLNAFITFTPSTTGTFFLSAEAFSFDQTGTYIVEVYDLRPAFDGIPGDASTPVTLSAPTTFSSQVDFAGDQDWLRVAFNEGDTYQIALNGQAKSDDPLGDPVLELYDANGVLLAVNDDGGPGLNALLNYTAPGSGAYFVNARAYGGHATGFYQLEITGSPFLGDDIPNTTATTAEFSVNPLEGQQLFVSQIDFPGDRDVIRINLEANVLYSLWATGNEGDSALDPQFQLFQQDGTVVAADDDSGPGLSALRDFYVTEPETYYLRVQDSGIGVGEYILVFERDEEEMDVRTTLSEFGFLSSPDTDDVIADSCTSGRASDELREACASLIEAAAGEDPGVAEALKEITPEKAIVGNVAVRQNNQVQNRNIGDRMVALRVGATGTSFSGLASAPSIQNTRSVKQADPIQKGEEIFNVNIVFDSMLGDIAFDQSTVTYDETGAMTGGQLIIEFLKRPLSKFGAYYVLDVETGYGRICLNYETDGCNPGVNTMLETTGSRTAGLVKSDQRVNTFVVDPQISGAREVGTSASLKAWANSGLPVIFGSATPGTCTVSDSVVTFHAPGTCTVTADQAGNNHFNAAPQAAIDIAVAREDQEITGFDAVPTSGV
ncbi:MAG: S8 family serine peptidase, partial [Candidatus Competibacteraceae bacterium]|nr:S8 family serine peptidase [Candidatus Competibacteraceae bacterium]